MNLVLFDDPVIRLELLPFTFTRPVCEIRVGILTIAEKWEKWLTAKASYQTEKYLQKKFAPKFTDDNVLINGAVCPDQKLVDTIKSLPAGYYLVQGSFLIAAHHPEKEMESTNTIEYTDPIKVIDRPWKIFTENGREIRADFKLVTEGRKSAPLPDKHTVVYGEENLFVEDGVTIKAAVINAENGPVYLGKNSIIQEGALIRGAFALCEGGHLNMGVKIRGDVTVGPYSKVGGEISTTVVFGNSNKAHDGFLGCSVLGEWCNLGADTNTSNLKNNYDTVKLWRHVTASYESTGLQFCGLMMGDHSKCSINTMFNTGTVVDVSANIFGGGFPKNYIPSFTWGGSGGVTTYDLDKALETARRVMERRNLVFDDIEKEILTHVFQLTAPTRL
ncbi:GlmU family protein [Chryseosolibacter indicus]|uniref:GlmU family protein n=1 Tax=Chryseosolibacter indicus TaxID=2782351 RepID=A0ABS5VTQ8_9BACT|nr:GlmU family protein [Chryseosolibacter indicus]MBT1704805.1 GlmU family protein [Chryseosolibacter indicus]